MKSSSRVAIISGANRGIGLEVVRQLALAGHTVVLGSRDLAKGRAAAASLAGQQLAVHPYQLDVSDPVSVENLVRGVTTTFGRVNIVVNNAAILYDTWQRAVDADLAVIQEAMDTNLLGAWRLAKAVIPPMHKHRYGRIVNVSSEGGSLASMSSGTPAYSVSKAALNALTRILAAELRGSGILVNAVCPGWVATDMGGSGGRPVADGAAGIVWAATLPANGPNGGFFRDGKPLSW
jgi:NAD(P)-dependent dehydrogenase (short-subunit alcohol dehydrogenase family)